MNPLSISCLSCQFGALTAPSCLPFSKDGRVEDISLRIKDISKERGSKTFCRGRRSSETSFGEKLCRVVDFVNRASKSSLLPSECRNENYGRFCPHPVTTTIWQHKRVSKFSHSCCFCKRRRRSFGLWSVCVGIFDYTSTTTSFMSWRRFAW